MKKIDYHIPTKLIFGVGRLNDLATISLPGEKALIVTTSGKSIKQFGYLDRVVDLLKQNNDTEAIIFDKVLSNPLLSHVIEAATLCRCEQCDFVIGLGGGSPIDSAKSIAIMACNDGVYWDYVNGREKVNCALPIIAINTTAGTGTEMDPWTVITHDQHREKMGFGCEYTFPAISIVDPELMLTIPPLYTAYQGFDAFFHAAEGYIARVASPMSDMFALRSMRLLWDNLPIAVNDGNNIEARSNVALASTLAGMVESTSSCISQHALEHPMSAFYPSLPHGAGLIMLSRAYFTHFSDVVPERMAEMVRNLGIDTSSMLVDECRMAFVDAITELQHRCSVAGLKMSDYGIVREDLHSFITNARQTSKLFRVDPAPLSDEDIFSIYEKSYM